MNKTLTLDLVLERDVRVLLATVVVNNKDDSSRVPLRSFTTSSSSAAMIVLIEGALVAEKTHSAFRGIF